MPTSLPLSGASNLQFSQADIMLRAWLIVNSYRFTLMSANTYL